MYIMKRLLFTCLILLFSSKVCLAAGNNPVQLYFGADTVSSEIRVVEKNGNSFINLPFLSKYLNIVTAWDTEQRDLFLKFGKINIKMYENSTSYYINGKQVRLPEAPYEEGGQLWLPIQFLFKLGLTVKSQNSNQITLTWANNYLLAMEDIKYQDHPAILLIGSQALKAKDVLLSHPDRLVLELPDTMLHFSADNHFIENPNIKRVHFEQQTNLKVVLDLNQSNGYRIIPVPEHPERLMIVFNCLLEDIQLHHQDSEREVFIKTSAPVEYQIISNTSNQLIVDLNGATLTKETWPNIYGDGEWLDSIRVSQPNSQKIQLKFNFLSAGQYNITRSPDHPNILEISTIRQITAICWLNTESGGQLSIAANGELNAIVDKNDKSSLEIDLNNMQFTSGLTLPTIQNTLVNGIKMINLNPTSARVEINLANYVCYHTEVSSDKRSLLLDFKHSPLFGKTIIIDPGHGGNDNGAWGRQDTREKEINLETAMHLKDMLEQAGAAVILTRNDDYFISLYERCYLANYLSADLFISIHANNNPDLSVHGVEVHYYPGRREAEILATDVINNMVQTTGLKSLGIIANNLIVVRETQMPSILVEVGYLSNFQEETVIKTPEFKLHAAEGIFQGVMGYYEKY